VALTGSRDGWLDYEVAAASPAAFDRPHIDERDLLAINYTSGTTSRLKGVMITHRNAWMNSIGVLVHVPMGPGDRYLWTLPMLRERLDVRGPSPPPVPVRLPPEGRSRRCLRARRAGARDDDARRPRC
jgi:hypothetical protein